MGRHSSAAPRRGVPAGQPDRRRGGEEDRPHGRRERGRGPEEEQPAAPLAAAVIGRSGCTGRNEEASLGAGRGRRCRALNLMKHGGRRQAGARCFCRRTAARVGAAGGKRAARPSCSKARHRAHKLAARASLALMLGWALPQRAADQWPEDGPADGEAALGRPSGRHVPMPISSPVHPPRTAPRGLVNTGFGAKSQAVRRL